MGRALALDSSDNVATALTELEPGEEVTVRIPESSSEIEVVSESAIPFGHKISLESISSGDPVRKYGAVIGTASKDIPVGDHVHVHNVESQKGRGDQNLK